ncbi:MAG: zinc-ribbon domain-containing protein, partial [Planctomycetes bacterium]|nr:zinc-ribbon domain-containing protein [Planctomycetota bacterium]
MFCPNCGQPAAADARFCPGCGTGLATGATPRPTPASPTPARTPPAAQQTFSGGQTLAGPGSNQALLEPGAVFHGRYRIENVLGRGGMGVVYCVHDDVTGDRVVLKVILPSLVDSEDLSRRFLREGKLARDLRHANIVSVYDVNCADGIYYLSMELLEGTSLRKYLFENLRSKREVPLAEACRILRPVLAGLSAAHEAGVIHRDLKPENVMLLGDPAGDPLRVKILDFGIARALRSKENLTVAGAAMGTPIYMAPEQETGADTAGPEADLYSAAVIFYEILLGIPPRGRWELPGKVRPALPPALDPFFEKALHSHPSRRLRNVAEFLQAMEKAAGGGRPAAPPVVPVAPVAPVRQPPPIPHAVTPPPIPHEVPPEPEPAEDRPDPLAGFTPAWTKSKLPWPWSKLQWTILHAVPCFAWTAWLTLALRTRKGKHFLYAAIYSL